MDQDDGFSTPDSYYVNQRGVTVARRKRTVPKYVWFNTGTNSPRGFRDWHRNRVRFAMRALRLTMQGSAYSPAYRDLQIAMQALTRAVEETSRAKWGR